MKIGSKVKIIDWSCDLYGRTGVVPTGEVGGDLYTVFDGDKDLGEFEFSQLELVPVMLTKIPCPRCGSTIFFDETFCEQCGYIKTDKEVGYGEGSDDSNVEPTPIPPPSRNHGGGA